MDSDDPSVDAGHVKTYLAELVCRSCPVRRRCLQTGLHDEYLVWGGASPVERKLAVQQTASADEAIDLLESTLDSRLERRYERFRRDHKSAREAAVVARLMERPKQ